MQLTAREANTYENVRRDHGLRLVLELGVEDSYNGQELNSIEGGNPCRKGDSSQ